MVKGHSDSERGQEIAQWVHPMKNRSDDPSLHERTLLPRSYISLHHEGSIRRPIAPWANAITTELHLAPPWRIDPTTHRSMSERSYHGATYRSLRGGRHFATVLVRPEDDTSQRCLCVIITWRCDMTLSLPPRTSLLTLHDQKATLPVYHLTLRRDVIATAVQRYFWHYRITTNRQRYLDVMCLLGTCAGLENSMFRRPWTTYFFRRASENFQKACPPDNHGILSQWLNISKGKRSFRHGPHSNPKSAIVIVLAGMTCMMFIPCILVQDEAETRLNWKQY